MPDILITPASNPDKRDLLNQLDARRAQLDDIEAEPGSNPGQLRASVARLAGMVRVLMNRIVQMD